MPATDLIISEYIEGSSNNKALELYNGTGSAIDLSGYVIQVYFNGSSSAGLTINLSGTVQPGDVFVLAHSAALEAILAEADQSNGAGWFNGDDAIVLRKGGAAGEIVDSIGQIGVDPGSQWGSGDASTADNTLVRDASVTSGDTNPFDSFVPSDQWSGHPQDTFEFLGSHTGDSDGYAISPLAGTDFEGDSGTTSLTFTVTRGDSSSAESIDWFVGAGAGLPSDADPDDFAGGALPAGTVVFAEGQASATITIDVAGDLVSEVTETFTVTLDVEGNPTATGTILNDDVLLTDIATIQGAAHRSPLEGRDVSTVGIVTGVTSNGFWIQDATPDDDAATSDGIFVFTGSAPAASVVIGAEVVVTGRVSEFFPNSDTDAELSLTEIEIGADGWVKVTGQTGTIAPTIVGAGGLLPPGEDFGDDDNGFDPATEGLDFWESLEGMVVTLNDAVASGPSSTNGFDDTEVFAYAGGTGGDLTPSGGLIAQPGDFNPERIAIQEDNRVFNNDFQANVGDQLGDVTGIVSYERGGFYELLATAPFEVSAGGLAREESTALEGAEDQLTIASYNAENLSLRTPDEKFAEIAEQIVSGMLSPDIIALQEVQDDNGSSGGGIVTSDQTLLKLIAAIEAAGGPSYQFAYVTPEYNQDGGQSGGNIRQVFLYNPDRVQLADSSVGSATEGVTVADDGGTPDLSVSVGRIDPTADAFDNSRKPLVAEFLFNGESVFVINNHFASKIGDDPLFGTNQPPVEVTEAQRLEQAEIVAAFVEQILAIDPDANVAVVGDLNDFGFSDTLERLEDAGLGNLADLLPANERYDYVFQGNAQQLDHILVSGNLGEDAAFDILHVNSEFADQTSDHDPLIARLNIGRGLTLSGGNGDDDMLGGAGDDWIDGGNGADRIDGGNGRDEIHGGRGADRLIGGNAADKLFGELGDDLLEGGAGNDLLSGGQGDDWLIGGDGADQFVVGNGGTDVVSDFEVGTDSLLFAEGVLVLGSAVGDVDGDGVSDLTLALGSGGSVVLLGVTDIGGGPSGLAQAPLETAPYTLGAHLVTMPDDLLLV